MIKSLTIELAFRRLNKPKVMPRPPSNCYSIEGNLKYYRTKYDVFELHYDMDDYQAIPGFYTSSSFTSGLNISSDKRELLQTVNYLLMKFLTSEQFINLTYIISDSYGYFCFTDENDKMIFATPHITSPLLFNPNDEEKLYELGFCGTLMYPQRKAIRQGLLKHIDDAVLRVEEGGNKLQPLEYTPQQIINSLLDYRENKAQTSSNIIQLGSIYEEKKDTGAILPSISGVSTYEFRAFNYVGPDNDDIEF
jgi:hypothetical protein